MIDERDPALRMAAVIREAVTCDRDHCAPETHVRFVAENLEIATKEINEAAR